MTTTGPSRRLRTGGSLSPCPAPSPSLRCAAPALSPCSPPLHLRIHLCAAAAAAAAVPPPPLCPILGPSYHPQPASQPTSYSFLPPASAHRSNNNNNNYYSLTHLTIQPSSSWATRPRTARWTFPPTTTPVSAPLPPTPPRGVAADDTARTTTFVLPCTPRRQHPAACGHKADAVPSSCRLSHCLCLRCAPPLALRSAPPVLWSSRSTHTGILARCCDRSSVRSLCRCTRDYLCAPPTVRSPPPRSAPPPHPHTPAHSPLPTPCRRP